MPHNALMTLEIANQLKLEILDMKEELKDLAETTLQLEEANLHASVEVLKNLVKELDELPFRLITDKNEDLGPQMLAIWNEKLEECQKNIQALENPDTFEVAKKELSRLVREMLGYLMQIIEGVTPAIGSNEDAKKAVLHCFQAIRPELIDIFELERAGL